MAQALTMDSQTAAVELYQILRELDPSRWRIELAQTMRPRIDALRARLQDLMDRADNPSLSSMRERLEELCHLLEHAIPTPERADVQQPTGVHQIIALRAVKNCSILRSRHFV